MNHMERWNPIIDVKMFIFIVRSSTSDGMMMMVISKCSIGSKDGCHVFPTSRDSIVTTFANHIKAMMYV